MLTDLTVGWPARSTTAFIPDALSPAVMVTNDWACVQFTAATVAASAASMVTCAVPTGRAPGGRAGAEGVDEEHPAILPTSTASPAVVTNRFRIRPPRYVEHRQRGGELKKNVATQSPRRTRKSGDSGSFDAGVSGPCPPPSRKRLSTNGFGKSMIRCGSTYMEGRPTRKSFTSSLTPLSRRAPAGDHSKPAALPAASRVDSATMTVPGRASAVTRLATFTGLPNQSPARLTASPDATPIRRRGRSFSAAASMRFRTACSSGAASKLMSITASPIDLTNRTGDRATSWATSANRVATRSRSSGGIASPRLVKPARSAKHTVTVRPPGSVPAALSAAVTASDSNEAQFKTYQVVHH